MQQNSFYDVFTSIGHFFKFFTTFFKRIPFIDIPSVRVIFSAKLPISYYRFSQVISWWYIYCSKYICMFKKIWAFMEEERVYWRWFRFKFRFNVFMLRWIWRRVTSVFIIILLKSKSRSKFISSPNPLINCAHITSSVFI